MALDQSTWNLLFAWLTPGRCMLPEGCAVPLVGVFFYLLLAAAAAVAVWKQDALRDRLSELGG